MESELGDVFASLGMTEAAAKQAVVAEVLAAEPRQPGFTLMNVLAQQRAQALQASGRDYF